MAIHNSPSAARRAKLQAAGAAAGRPNSKAWTPYNEAVYWETRYAKAKGTSGNVEIEIDFKVSVLAQLIQDEGAETILDLGSGDGRVAAPLLAKLEDVAYRGVDISRTAAVIAAEKIGERKAKLEVCDFLDPEFSGEADVVLCLDVLYHLSSQERHDRAVEVISKSFRKFAAICAWNETVGTRFPVLATHVFAHELKFGEELEIEKREVPNAPHKTLYILRRAQPTG